MFLIRTATIRSLLAAHTPWTGGVGHCPVPRPSARAVLHDGGHEHRPRSALRRFRRDRCHARRSSRLQGTVCTPPPEGEFVCSGIVRTM
eukprot:6866581-Pyramimonas_sp.AAC.1